jgi:GT2 family glycosyltransferase
VISVVIVTFSAEAAMLEACVASVLSAGDADQVIVVDNGGSAVVGGDIELIRPGHNLGFGGGANAGFRRAAALGATAVALLNDDIEVEAGWLRPLRAALDSDPALGAVQPKLLLAGSDPARVNSVGVIIGVDGAGTDIGYGELDGPDFTTDHPIESFTGGAVLFRSQFLQATHGFDESYFLY